MQKNSKKAKQSEKTPNKQKSPVQRTKRGCLPVMGELLINNLTSEPDTSTDQACVALLSLSVKVIETLLVPPAPCVTRHRSDVSDSHSVASPADCPPRSFTV
jgi:hypothetical protein